MVKHSLPTLGEQCTPDPENDALTVPGSAAWAQVQLGISTVIKKGNSVCHYINTSSASVVTVVSVGSSHAHVHKTNAKGSPTNWLRAAGRGAGRIRRNPSLVQADQLFLTTGNTT